MLLQAVPQGTCLVENMEMTDNTTPAPGARNRPSRRRMAMLASVASLGIAVGLAGPTVYHQAYTTPAFAAETVAQPSGFADIVAKVRPAVISVRVKVDDHLASFNGGNELEPGSPME